ncbi:hypothetical protein D3C87_1905030 [compost metagenome]
MCGPLQRIGHVLGSRAGVIGKDLKVQWVKHGWLLREGQMQVQVAVDIDRGASRNGKGRIFLRHYRRP